MGKTLDYNVGLLYLKNKFGDDLLERLNDYSTFQRNGESIKIKAEHVRIHEVDIDFRTKYSLFIDRCSHRIPQAVGLFMIFAFRGVEVINNPLSFHYFIANKDAAFAMAKSLGIPVPQTFILPSHDTPQLKQDEYLFHEPFNWLSMVEEVGFPCLLKPAKGQAALDVNIVSDLNELWHHYNLSGNKVMTLQQKVPSNHDWHVRCLCIGRKIIPIKFIFRNQDASEYIFDEDFLNDETGKKVVECARILNRLFGYEMNSVEFIIDPDGVPWAIDFNNPVPDSRREMLGDIYYNDYLEAMVELVVDKSRLNKKGSFLPGINEFSEIAGLDIPVEEKYGKALAAANEYYLRKID